VALVLNQRTMRDFYEHRILLATNVAALPHRRPLQSFDAD
jgi:hypothetical protein